MTKRTNRRLNSITACALLLLGFLVTSGCSTFNRDWKRAAIARAPQKGIEGRWEGRWISEVNGHNGRLRCLVSRLDDSRYQARFHAKYQKILSFSYTVLLDAKETNGVCKFEGEADLGWFAGGKYRYTGEATTINFFSTYDSKHDRGTFQMTRP
jgi:hypothetical protein